jgi:hypothetical protein
MFDAGKPAFDDLHQCFLQAGHAQGQDVFSRQIAVPPLPSKARYAASGAAADFPSGVPPADEAALAGLEYSDRQRLTKERSEAAGIDRGHAKVHMECLCTGLQTRWCCSASVDTVQGHPQLAHVLKLQAQRVLKLRAFSSLAAEMLSGWRAI